MTTTFQVSGMTCAHCVKSVTAEVGQVVGAETVDVQLVPGGVSLVSVSSAGPLDPAAVAAAIDEAGYVLVTATP
ncbi:heavy-metal-associated domain-containing protein [Cryobacterium fucosi]|uniref:heavy-metal-associated domain-containing protein n=1 Tax=Cryobacterium fucosi TaxID=1259157 RepID=UPI001F544606|nr:heavy-metal-associated domain-containing protein [Cryobacterium fucosi]